MRTALLRHSGISLLELLISSAIASGFLLMILQLYNHSNQIALQQQQLSRQLQNTESVRHLLSHSVRDALYTSLDATLPVESGLSCPGITIDSLCWPPLYIWEQGTQAPISAPPAVPGSYLFWIKQSCCPGVVADVFFLWYRAGNVANPPSLFRRRQMSDGRFSASEELVEGVSTLVPSLTHAIADVGSGAVQYLTGVSPRDISDWWGIIAVDFELTAASPTVAVVGDTTVSFTVVSRQWSQ